MLYWRRVLAVVRGCQAPECISAQPGGVRKRARLGYTERSCTSGLYSGSELRPILPRVKHVPFGPSINASALFCMKIPAQGDGKLERSLLRPKQDAGRHHEAFSSTDDGCHGPRRRRILRLNNQGRKIEKLKDALLKLSGLKESLRNKIAGASSVPIG